MEISFNRQLIDLDGKEIQDEAGRPATLRTVAVNALVATFQDEASLPGEEKLKRWGLALKIKDSPDPVELSAEEITLVKKLIGKGYGTIVVGQAWQMIEGKL